MESGVYEIYNITNGKRYIGSAVSFINRKRGHLSSLRGGYHHNIALQRAYNKYEEKSFVFRVLAICPKEYIIKLEQWFINSLNPEYNICKIAGNTTGVRPSIETKNKMIASRTGLKRSKDAIIRTAILNKKPITQYDMEMNYIKDWDSCITASIELSINKAHITGCCKGKVNSIGGFKWKYKSN